MDSVNPEVLVRATSSATAISTTTTATAISATAAAAAASIFAWLGFINGQWPSALHGIVEAADCSLRAGVGAHFDESKSLASAGVPVSYDLRFSYFAEFTEQLFEIG